MHYDIIVIGAGSGGLNIASFMNRAGFRVLLIDRSDKNIGGDCLNHGCVPSKALIHLSRLAADARTAKRFGLDVKGKIDLSKVRDYIKEKQDAIREHENAEYFRKKGMDVELGNAEFTGKDSVRINGKTHTAKKIVLATGSRPRRLPVLEDLRYETNETIFGIKNLPERLIVVGGGPIGIEIGQAFLRLGSKVSVILKGDTILPKEEQAVREILRKRLEKEGMEFYENSEIEKATEKELILSSGKRLGYEKILVSIGRELNTEDIGLEKAGISTEDGKIIHDGCLRTTNKNVLLCGDIVGSYKFTHAAELHAKLIITNFFSPFKKKLDTSNLSWVTYSSPEIATFGLRDGERLELGFDDDDRSIVTENTYGRLIIYVKNNKLRGGTMISENAGEIFQELVLANSSEMDIKEIFDKIYAYPTMSRVNKQIISNFFSRRLTEKTKKILKILY